MSRYVGGILVLGLCLSGHCRAQGQDTTRIRDLKRGVEVVVKGRTGEIKEQLESPGLHVFTLRDDYGDMAYISTQLPYPIMGATYFIKGRVNREPVSGKQVMDAVQIGRAYPNSKPYNPVPLIASVAGVVCAALLIGYLYMRKAIQSRTIVSPEEPWGYLEVLSGPDHDTGTSFPLRGDRIALGRAVKDTDVRTSALDQTVSRNHGELIREGCKVFYTDNNSTHGSRISGKQVETNQKVELPVGAVLQLGSGATKLVYILPDEGGKTLGLKEIENVEFGVTKTGL